MSFGILVFIIALLPFRADAQGEFFPICDQDSGMGAGLLGHDFSPQRLRDISQATKEVEPSPFTRACQNPELYRRRPETGLFNRSLPVVDFKGRTSKDFLIRVGRRAQVDLAGEGEWLKTIDGCLSTPNPKSPPIQRPAKEDCDVVEEWRKEFLEINRGARIDLALSLDAKSYTTIANRSGKTALNRALSTRGTKKETAWKPLENPEAEEAAGILQTYIDESKAKALSLGHKEGSPEFTKFTNDAVLGSRLSNGYNYVTTVSRYPLLQFMKSPQPTNDEIVEGIRQMRAALETDKKYAERLTNLAGETHKKTHGRSGVPIVIPRDSVDPEVLGLLDFEMQVELELSEVPHDCAIAVALHHTRSYRQIGNGLALGIPVAAATIAAPFFTPWFVGAAIGGAAGVGAVVDAKLSKDDAARKFFSLVEHEPVDAGEQTAVYKKSVAADKEFKTSLILPPAGALLGSAGRVIQVSKTAVSYGAKVAGQVATKSSAYLKAVPPGSAARLQQAIQNIRERARIGKK